MGGKWRGGGPGSKLSPGGPEFIITPLGVHQRTKAALLQNSASDAKNVTARTLIPIGGDAYTAGAAPAAPYLVQDQQPMQSAAPYSAAE